MERIIELIIDEENEISGVEAVSVVENPAIEEDFIALKKQPVELAEVDAEKRILMGPALIPNKKILRRDDEGDYHIYFSADTVRKASELFLSKGNQNNATLEHEVKLEGMSIVESWLIEDKEKDKSKKYNFDLPVGTWMVSMKVYNDDVWAKVKAGEVYGFSIEGFFADTAERPKEQIEERASEELLEELFDEIETAKYELATYNDYPDGVVSNAKRVLEWVEKNGWGSCGTPVGKRRASQLASRSNLTVSTIKRMRSFLARHASDLEASKSYGDGCGKLMYDAWGGKAGLRWAESKLKELGEIKASSEKINDSLAIIDDRLAYASEDAALKAAADIGCEGMHTHEFEGQTWYMPCEQHKLAEVGPRGGVRPSKKAPKSDTPNKNPKGKGTAKGNAKGKTGAKVSEKDRKSLKKKADDFNKRYKEKLGYGITVGMLASVFQRGLGAFNTSHSPNVKSPSQWAHARVNAFMYLVRNGRPQNAKYTTDYDLLPKKHPKSSKK